VTDNRNISDFTRFVSLHGNPFISKRCQKRDPCARRSSNWLFF
jgi:hypothetical protein